MTPEQKKARNRALAKQEVHRRKGRALGYGEDLLSKIRRVNTQDALALLLSHQCPSDVLPNDDRLFRFPLHCDGIVEVIARKQGRTWVVLSSRFINEPQ